MATVVQIRDPAQPPPMDLLALARSRDPNDRERLLLALTSLCQASGSQAASPILTEIFLMLARQAERDIRKALALRIADADWAPPALAHMLALDEIEIARPIIASSPLLNEDDLIQVLVEATLEHQIEVARRPGLGGRAADVIIDRGEAAVLTALAGNATAELGEAALRRLVEHARRVAALRSPLSRHPALSDALARELYSFVGAALRQAIAERFRVNVARMNGAVNDSIQAALDRNAPPPGLADEEREEMERRLVNKLAKAGQLSAGYLIRAVREGRVSLFEHGLAAMGEFNLSHVRAALRHPSPEPISLACSAVGIDRAVMPALLDELRRLTGGLPGGGDPKTPRIAKAPEVARREFRALVLGPTARAV